MKRTLLLLLLTSGQLVFASSNNSKIAPDVPTGSPLTMTPVIIQFKAAPSASDLNSWGSSGQVVRSFPSIHAFHVVLPEILIPIIASLPDVAYISPANRHMNGLLDVTTQTVGANQAWSSGYTGAGIGVAVVDSGIAAHPDLGSRIVYSQSFATGEATPTDLYGHGTHVAGIIGSSGASSTGPGFTRTFKGVAPNVNLINLKALNETGSGQVTDVISAIEAAIQLQSTYNIRVLNLSVGQPVYESYALDPLCQAVEAAWKAGITVVVAAGNYGRDGYGTITSPGNDPHVITVGASNSHGTPNISDDTIASYSSKGPTLIDHIVKPDLVAPGNAVVSLLASTSATLFAGYPTTHVPLSYYETSGPGGPGPGPGPAAPGALAAASTTYYQLSGTSMATPVVSGAAALLLQQNPALTPDQVKARLMRNTQKILPTYMNATDSVTLASYSMQADIFTVGAGYLDIPAALADTNLAPLPALSPTVTYDAVHNQVELINNSLYVWGSNIIWGDNIIWGTSVFTGQVINGMNIIWGDSVAWGNSTLNAFNIIWGDTVSSTTTLSALADGDGDQ
jgi:serine protease AprX